MHHALCSLVSGEWNNASLCGKPYVSAIVNEQINISPVVLVTKFVIQ